MRKAEISPRYLSEDERVRIADLQRRGLSVRAIAVEVGRSPSTVSRELRRNRDEGSVETVRSPRSGWPWIGGHGPVAASWLMTWCWLSSWPSG